MTIKSKKVNMTKDEKYFKGWNQIHDVNMSKVLLRATLDLLTSTQAPPGWLLELSACARK